MFNSLILYYLFSYKSINGKILTKQRQLSIILICIEKLLVYYVEDAVVMLINQFSFCKEMRLCLQNSLKLVLSLQREKNLLKTFLCISPPLKRF